MWTTAARRLPCGVMSTTSASKKFVFGDIGHCVAFGFGVGLTPKIPGTAGTLLALPLYWLSNYLMPGAVGKAAAAAALTALGIWLCGRAGRMLGKHDDGGIVLDEIAGFYLALLLSPSDEIGWTLAAFVLFRFLDAAKPPPIGWLDKNIGGGLGVMADDIAAALLCAAILQIAALIL